MKKTAMEEKKGMMDYWNDGQNGQDGRIRH